MQLSHAAVAAAAASMGMESPELVAVAHYQAQQLQRQLLAEQSGSGAMLPPAAQPTGGGLTQSLQQPQQAQLQGQDSLQQLMQQIFCLQQIEYFFNQRVPK